MSDDQRLVQDGTGDITSSSTNHRIMDNTDNEIEEEEEEEEEESLVVPMSIIPTTPLTINSTSTNDDDDDDDTNENTNTSTNKCSIPMMNESESSFYTNFREGCTYLQQDQWDNNNNNNTSSGSISISNRSNTINNNNNNNNNNTNTTDGKFESVVAMSSSSTTTGTTPTTTTTTTTTTTLQHPPSSVLPNFLSHVTVNFIDPTTSSIMMSSSGSSSGSGSTTGNTSSSSVGYSAAVKKAKINQSIQLYEKFQRIFTTHYNNTLTAVPYQLFRNHMIRGVISTLPIRTIVTRGHGGFIVTDDHRSNHNLSSNINNNKVHGDYSWEQPYCYVYLAACESLDHYRTKVKPSIQVFISQLEAAIKASASPSSSALSRFRRTRSTGDAPTTTNNNTNIIPSSNNANDTSLDESINGGGGLDVSTTGKTKKTKRIPPAPRYVIIYVPTGNNNTSDSNDSNVISPVKTNKSSTSTTSSSTTATSALGASVASRFAAARQRMSSAVTVGRTTSNSATSDVIDTSGGGGGGDDTTVSKTTATNHEVNTVSDDDLLLGQQQQQSTTVVLPPSIQQLNRMEREIARRFASDFPAGNVCTVSTLFDAPDLKTNDNPDTQENANSNSTAPVSENVIQQLEWQAVLKAMGNAIMASFHDRCQRYDDEIRLIDHKRRGLQQQDSHSSASTSTPTKQPSNVSNDGEMDESTNGTISSLDDFHLCNFFLVKENLAFTYEQMRLPSEALLQYEELRAFLPDRMDAQQQVATSSIAAVVTDDDKKNDRKSPDQNELSDLALRGDILEFRRLLKMHGDTATIQHVADEYLFAREVSLLFQMKKSARIMQRCYSYVLSTFDMKKRQIDEMDISTESRQVLIDLYKWAYCYCWYIKHGSDCLFTNRSFAKSPEYIACARCVCDVLEFARQCFENVGDLVLSESGVLLRPYNQEMIKSLKGPWNPWQESTMSEIPVKPTIRFATPNEFLQNALSSKAAFAERYCDILDTVATCHECCGRRRYAARLRIERVDILDANDNKVDAAKEILSFFNLYRIDQWNACHFVLLFRLVGFQRVAATTTEYLDTLVRCFYRGVHDIAPPKALMALHTDLLSVLQSSSVKGARYAAASLFGPTFGLEGMTSKSLPGSDRSLVKKLYTLGDTIQVNLALNSFLFKDIEVDSVCINLVPFPKYVAAMEDSVLITDADIHHVIALSNVTVSTGANVLIGEWQPICSGQFIIASLCIVWSGVNFTYTAKEIRRPTIRIDVVPCAPSQTLEVTPKYLLVGQEQLIQIELNTNKDCVIDGKLVLDGPSNVSFCHHDFDKATNNWVSTLELPIQPCEPFQKVLHKAQIKVASVNGSESSVQNVRVKLLTTYKYSSKLVNVRASERMQSSLDATIKILDTTAFKIQSCDLLSYSSDKVLVNAVMECNSDTNLTIKSWSIDLPSYYALCSDGDMNESLANEVVSRGDRVSLTFGCRYVSITPGVSVSNSILHITFENDMGSQLRESVKLRLKSSIDAAMTELEATPTTVKIVSSVKELLVGLSVDLIYTIDLSAMDFTLGKITYQIATDHVDWILHGKNVGVISATSDKTFVVTIVAIPIRPGPIYEYPPLSLICLCYTGVTKVIPTAVESKEIFTSLAPSDHTSVAYYTGSEAQFL